MDKEFVIVAIAKNENAFVIEWINYHLAVGFGHIFLYDNAGPDDENLDFLSPLYPEVTVTKLPGPGRQSAAYRHFCANFKSETKWVAFIDLDEFIMFKAHRNVQGFISEFGHLSTIALSWLMFGHSKHVTRPGGLVMDNYVWRYPFIFPQIKTLALSSSFDEVVSVHNVTGRAKLINGLDLQGQDKIPLHDEAGRFHNEWDTTDIVGIHHYFSRSLEDIEKKLSRGSAAGTVGRNFDWYLNNTKVFNSTLDLSAPILIRDFARRGGERYKFYLDNESMRGQRFEHVVPADFDAAWYGSFYPDLHQLGPEQLVEHFRVTGAFEKRAWCEAVWQEGFFDPAQYMKVHSDVAAAAGQDNVSARYHYFVAGRFENRSMFIPKH